MPRILVPADTLIGRGLAGVTVNLIETSQQVNRLKGIMDAITNNGAQKALLESSAESKLPAGSGAAIYDGVSQIKTALDTLASLVASIDRNL